MDVEPQNRRRARRIQHEIPVAYRTVGGYRTDWASDVCRDGMFVNTPDPLAAGTDLKVLLQFPAVDFPIGLHGRVVRVVPDGRPGPAPGMGIRFTGVDASRRRQLASLIRRLRRELRS